ncbi:prepilin-type N-terminal cleavage/methylation domain-containing protein [Lysobacter soli]|uniref:type IV pilin protein n=1 Tax=Lysobacter soli TaxID=453783 RepID=UPI0012EE1716|nr:type IV pilin protein [Lysobacter soli]QGW65929.1 prepilin-type N-terminal cleavage/methylation domain-containing protein [Lysobacter soli]
MSSLSSRRRSARGFTLVELMIVVAVVAILASIAYPSYNDAVRKSRRGQAKADLLEVAQMAERFRTVNGTYAGFTVPTTKANSPSTGTARYTVAVSNATAAGYTLTATPVSGAGQERDAKCLALTLTQSGAKSATGSDPSVCW